MTATEGAISLQNLGVILSLSPDLPSLPFFSIPSLTPRGLTPSIHFKVYEEQCELTQRDRAKLGLRTI